MTGVLGKTPVDTIRPDPFKKKDEAQKSLSDLAYDLITRGIISLNYLPGQHLEEDSLVKNLGIGRTPIREAFVRLLQEGILVFRSGRSMMVRPIAFQTVKSVFKALEMIEMGVIDRLFETVLRVTLTEWETTNNRIRTAMRGADIFGLLEAYRAFHLQVAECAENEYLWFSIKNIRNETRRLSNFCREQYTGCDIETLMQEHAVPDIGSEKPCVISDWTSDTLKKNIIGHLNSYKQVMIHIMI